MARKPPRSPEQRLARWSRSMAPGTLNGRVASAAPLTVDLTGLAPRLRQQPKSDGGFDPNADPVIIGSSATAGGGSTPGNVSSGFQYAVSIGHNADAEAATAVAVGSAATADADGAVGIGLNCWAHGARAVSIGPDSAAKGPDSIAIGNDAGTDVSGQYGISIGAFVYVGGEDGIGIGRDADVEEDDGIAIGRFSVVGTGHTQSAAFGFNARTTKPYQIMLGAPVGTSGTPYFVEIAGSGLVLKDSATGTRYLVQVTSGAITLSAAP